MSLILPPHYSRSKEVEKEIARQSRGYARHIPCGGVAFYFKRFGKAWFDYDASEILFKDGQIKLQNKPVEDYKCSDCGKTLQGDALKLIKIVREDEADALHAQEHRKVPVGVICELCGERRKP